MLSKLLCGFRSKHNTQHALLYLLKAWQQCLDKSGLVGTILMDLSKVFDSLPHDLIIAKLSAYGLSKQSLKLLSSYLNNRKQRTKIGSKFSIWLEILLSVPQGSGPLLFNIFINDLMLSCEEIDICNFADDNSICSCYDNIDSVVRNLKNKLNICLEWFRYNQLVANPEKFQLMFLGLSNDNLNTHPSIMLEGLEIKPTNTVKLLGIDLDNRLTMQIHINKLCSFASRNINCLARIRKFLNFNQAMLLYNAYIKSIFSYAPLTWMFCQKNSYKRIEKIQKRSLRLVFRNNNLTLDEIFAKHNITSFHIMHLRFLAVEIFKIFKDLNPIFMTEIFFYKETKHFLRSSNLLKLPETKSKRWHKFCLLPWLSTMELLVR